MKPLHWSALVLVIVGALNWGLWGLFQMDLVAALFGGQTALPARIVYGLVGLAGLIVAATSLAFNTDARTAGYARTGSAVPSTR